MKKLALLLLSAGFIFSISVKDARAWIILQAQNPTLITSGSYGGLVTQTEINNAVASALQTVNAELLKYQYQPQLGKGFANAGAYSAHAATQRNFSGYDIFAITVGTMAGAHVPSFDLDYYKDFSEKLKYKGDFYAGVALVPYSVQLGLHLGKFVKVLDRMYVSLKFGYLRFTYDDYSVDGINAGFMFNYQIFKRKKAGFQVFMWRGVSVGAGYLYQRNNFKLNHKLNKTTGDVPNTSGVVKYQIEPQLQMKIFSEASVVPIEINTSVRLLWILNFSAGAGIDFAVSKSKITARGYSYAYVLDYTQQVSATPGLVVAYGEQKGTVGKWYFPKVMAAFGLSFGPVVIDIPVTYYFIKGFNAGVSIGFEW